MVLSILDQLAATTKRTEKESILKDNFNNNILKLVFQMALDPYLQFYIKKIPKYQKPEDVPFASLVWALNELYVLSSRDVTGNNAVEFLRYILASLHPDDAVVIERVIGKDLRCGVQASTVNKIWNGLIPGFECSLADKFEEKRVHYPCSVETKLDGIRCLAFVNKDNVEFFSRSGKPFNTLASLEKDILASGKFEGFVLDGELVSGNFNNTMSDITRKEGDAKDAQFIVFDLLTIDEFQSQSCEVWYSTRRENLFQRLQGSGLSMVKMSTAHTCFTKDQIYETYNRYIEEGFEGAIVKNHKSPYEFKRSKHWLKIKPEDSVDVEIIGYEEGTGKYLGKLGAFIVNFNGVECRVGGGFLDTDRENFWNSRDEMLGALIEVQYMEVTPDGSMRHPRFMRVRSYKGEKV